MNQVGKEKEKVNRRERERDRDRSIEVNRRRERARESARSATTVWSVVEIWRCAMCSQMWRGWRTSMSVGMACVPAAMLEAAHRL
jgi:IS5 family transposase